LEVREGEKEGGESTYDDGHFRCWDLATRRGDGGESEERERERSSSTKNEVKRDRESRGG
jgi:hypothetical protein